MVERSRRTQDMNDNTTARMLLTAAALAAVAALFAGGANARLMDVDGGTAAGAATLPSGQPEAIPYVSHGIGVDASRWSGQTQGQLTGVHAALQRDRSETASAVGPATIPYLSQGQGVDASRFGGSASLGLTGDSPLTRVSAPEPEGLTGDSALTRRPVTITTTAASDGNEIDWTSFGAGAGMAALLAAAVAGVVLTTRRRGGVALP
jgi:hypothetical protein